MGIKDKINFRQPKYMLPAIIYFPLLFFGYFFFRFFNTEKAEVNNKMQTTEYYNDKLPDANLKGDGIGDKYSNMVNNFGKIKDESAVENIERGNEDQKEEYNSQYSDAEVAAMDRKRIRDAAFFLIIMLVTFAATLLNPQKYVSSRTIQKCVEHVSTST